MCNFRTRQYTYPYSNLIYILDWSKGMYIDECENCTIVVGPIDGSIFIRKCKNCKVSIIARQVRFRDSENIEIFTYCPSDPVVESSFNIFFAPFNAFFPHLSELFEKGGFNSSEKNHIDSVYDFTPSEVLGGGAAHFSLLPARRKYCPFLHRPSRPRNGRSYHPPACTSRRFCPSHWFRHSQRF